MRGGRNKIELVGKIFGRLTVVSELPRVNRKILWLCRCTCGKEISLPGVYLRGGETKSCGCLRKEVTAARGVESQTHGLTDSRIFNIHQGMKKRCLNKNHVAYFRYGGRGITICTRWLKFENFIADMGYPPSPRHTLDRIDNNGNYEPSNCRWANWEEQQSNKRNNRILECNGKKLNVTQWAIVTGIPRVKIYDRLRHGWSAKDALSVK